MKISLFIPCFVDQLAPQVGIAMVEVFERLGHEVEYPPRQTCCGQPAFNAGYHEEARCVARHFLDCFRNAEAIVAPSGSCAAMVRVHFADLFPEQPQRAAVDAIARKTWEFSEFLVDKLGVADVSARFPARATYHDGCHSLRELGIHAAPRTLLGHVRDLELVEIEENPSCCGFGGTFAVKFSELSTAMAEVRCAAIERTGARYVISGDPSCLLQIQGYLHRRGHNIACLHLAEVLARR